MSNGKGQILQKRLFTGSAVSPMGKVRDVWRGHLGLSTDDDLRPIIGSLVIMSGISEWHLEERLEARLAKAGLVAVDPGSARHAYADLAKAFIDQGNTDFDAFRVARLFRMAQPDPRAGVPIQGYNANLEYGVAEFKDASSRRTSLATVARRIRASLRPCAFHLSSLRSGSNPRR